MQRQHSDIDQMLFSVAQVIAELSKLFELKAGDLIFTGTPAGVAALKSGDAWHARLEGIAELRGRIGLVIDFGLEAAAWCKLSAPKNRSLPDRCPASRSG